ncbi:MAG: hypothetical protein ACOC2U_05285 [bacterium]
MKIGNVIYNTDLVKHDKVEYINYLNKSIPFENLNTDLPTLYVGWDFLKETHKDSILLNKFDILEKVVQEGKLYWEFSFDENKPQHVNGVDDFVNGVPKKYFENNFQYINLSPLFYDIHLISDFFKFIGNKIDVFYNYKDEIYYIYNGNKIFGIDINIIKLLGFNLDALDEQLELKTISRIDDKDGKTALKYQDMFSNYDNIRRYIPIILKKLKF